MSKDITAAYVYKGSTEKLLEAVRKAINNMGLNIKNQNINKESFSFEVSEKMKWLTTNWPIKFRVDSTFANGSSTLIIKASSTLTSYTQEFSNQAKINEFLDLVKTFAPNQPDTSIADLEKLSDLKNNGIITEEEFNTKKSRYLAYKITVMRYREE